MKEEEIKEARKFIRQNPDQNQYIADNYRNFWNYTYDGPDDDSVELGEEWDEIYKLSGYEQAKNKWNN